MLDCRTVLPNLHQLRRDVLSRVELDLNEIFLLVGGFDPTRLDNLVDMVAVSLLTFKTEGFQKLIWKLVEHTDSLRSINSLIWTSDYAIHLQPIPAQVETRSNSLNDGLTKRYPHHKIFFINSLTKEPA